ncbi:MAG: hypothetical protein AAF559_00300 [Pseudomonadota bacterium]
MKTRSLRKQASKLVLAVALATGTAMVAGHIVPDAAHAQRAKKDRKKKKENQPQYSKEFVAAYQPLNEAVNAEGADVAPLVEQVKALIPLAVSADEKNALGGLVYNTGTKTSNPALQLQGMEMLLSAGKVPIDNVGRFNFIAYQIANSMNDFPKARQYLQGAIDTNFTTDTVGIADLQIAMAESYFAAEDYYAGLDYLDKAIKRRKNQGLDVSENWYRRGITVAYNNELVPQVYDVAVAWVADFPSEDNWRDAINLARNLNDFGQQEILDLFRLSRKVGALSEKQDYLYYVESADARRLPKEVKEVIEQAYAEGAISADDIFISDSLETANNRIETDVADLPELEQAALAADAELRTVNAAGNTFLSYGDFAKAETFFQKALTLPGVETNEALTRLGIAQVGLEKHTEAAETFRKIEGTRTPIATLWKGYADMQTSAAADDGPSLGDLMGA